MVNTTESLEKFLFLKKFIKITEEGRWVKIKGICVFIPKSLEEKSENNNFILFHETHKRNLESIKKTGLKPPKGINPAKWFMLTDSLEGAKEYAGSRKHHIILEYHIPIGESNQFLWLKGGSLSKFYGFQIGIKKPIPRTYLRKTHSLAN